MADPNSEAQRKARSQRRQAAGPTNFSALQPGQLAAASTQVNPNPADGFTTLIQALLGQMQQPRQPGIDLAGLIREQRNTPVADAANAYQARLASDPWGAGGAFAGRGAAALTPQQVAMSQGANATNQWLAQTDPQLAAAIAPPSADQNRQMLMDAGLIQAPTPAPTPTPMPAGVAPQVQPRGLINGLPPQQAIAEAYPVAQQRQDQAAFQRTQNADLATWRKKNPQLASNIRRDFTAGLLR